jgi:hypothetical protein
MTVVYDDKTMIRTKSISNPKTNHTIENDLDIDEIAEIFCRTTTEYQNRSTVVQVGTIDKTRKRNSRKHLVRNKL